VDYAAIEAREAVLQSTVALSDLMATHITIYLTLLFAYIVVSYLVGADLTRLQLLLVTLLFIAASCFEVFNIAVIGYAATLKAGQLAEFGGSFDRSIQPVRNQWPEIVLWSSGIFAALIFMWTVRRPKAG
jgi:hypothetical protein